jgi:hypothetical protein
MRVNDKIVLQLPTFCNINAIWQLGTHTVILCFKQNRVIFLGVLMVFTDRVNLTDVFTYFQYE